MKNLPIQFLAQINTLPDLHNTIGDLLGIVVDISYLYAVLVLIMSLTQERGDGSWKFGIVKSFGIFAAVGICNIILNKFFPGQHCTKLQLMRLRDTQAKLRRRIKFLGVENGTLPIIISGGLSACFVTAASGSNDPWMIALALSPFAGTMAYMLLFYSGRRPHFARDLVVLLLEGKAVSPRMKEDQPVNPFYGQRD